MMLFTQNKLSFPPTRPHTTIILIWKEVVTRSFFITNKIVKMTIEVDGKIGKTTTLIIFEIRLNHRFY